MNILKNTFFVFIAVMIASACAKKDGYTIPYEQMPVKLKDNDVDPKTRTWLAEYKQDYSRDLLLQLIGQRVDREMDAAAVTHAAPSGLVDPERNLNLTIAAHETTKVKTGKMHSVRDVPPTKTVTKSSLNIEFVKKVKDWTHEGLKADYEKLLASLLDPVNAGLAYDEKAKEIISPFVDKKLNALTGSFLWQWMNVRVFNDKHLSERTLVMIMTPGHIQPGYLIEDPQQGNLLMGFETLALGSAKTYYGPVKNLKGQIAVVDAQLFMVLYLLKNDLDPQSLAPAREFALMHTAGKYSIDREKIGKINFRDDADNPFEIAGTRVQTLPDASQVSTLVEQKDVIYRSEFSSLDLAKSLTGHDEMVKRDRDDRIAASQRSRVGSLNENAAPWLEGYSTFKELEDVVQAGLKNKKDVGSEIIVPAPNLDRKCVVSDDVQGLPDAEDKRLRASGILGMNKAWQYQEFKSYMGICVSIHDLGGAETDPNFVRKYSRVAEPIYVLMQKKPDADMSDAQFEAQRRAIFNTQKSYVAEIEKTVCKKMTMDPVVADDSAIENSPRGQLANDLFVGTKNLPANNPVWASYNVFSIRCTYRSVAAPVREPEGKGKPDDKKYPLDSKGKPIDGPKRQIMKNPPGPAKK